MHYSLQIPIRGKGTAEKQQNVEDVLNVLSLSLKAPAAT